MHSRTTFALTALTAAFVTALSASTASAEELRDREDREHRSYRGDRRYREDREDPGDRSRLRYGAALEVGGLFAPGVVDLGFVGVQGQLGIQLDDLIGVYAAPHIDLVSGRRERGVQLGGAMLVDFTLAHVFTVGVGPDIAAFVALGDGELAGGILYGARLHLAVNPLVDISRNGNRRRGLTLGFDLRLVAGGAAGALSTRRAAADEIAASPTFTIGYQAF